MQDDGMFQDAFPLGIPANSNIDKSKTGNGMTTVALKSAGHYIIINPQTNTIDDKKAWCEERDGNVLSIHSDANGKQQISDEAIEEFLISPLIDKKILVTPESFPRIIKAAAEQKMLPQLHKEYFCLLDESHCYASEKFREMILNPLYYVFRFDRIALGSATPFNYSHPRIAALQKYKLIYPKPFGHVNIINCNDALSTLHTFLTDRTYAGNVHIFLNSVTAISNIVASTKITDIKIHCVDNEENRLKLGESAKYLSMETNGSMAKCNSYTCRYDEGWDMFDDANATLFFVTHKSIPHSMQSISIKGVQSMGRLRMVKPNAIFHITSNYGLKDSDIPSFDQYSEKAKLTAESHVSYFNGFTKRMGFDNQTYKLVKPYVYKNKRDFKVIDPGKVDQHIYEIQSRLEYANERTIALAWESRNFTTTQCYADAPNVDIKDVSTIEAKRRILNLLIQYDQNPECYQYGEANKVFSRLKTKHHLLIQCYQLFGPEGIEQLEYDNTKMKQKLIEHNNSQAHNKITQVLNTKYNINDNPSRASVKQFLNELYEEYGYYGTDGKIKKAVATDLKTFGIKFDNDKTGCNNGKRESSLRIASKDFCIKKAA